MRLAKLPSAKNYRKFAPVPAKSGAGISLLKNHRAQRRSSEALFLCLLVMAGHSGALRSAGSLWPVRLTLFGLPPNRLASTVAVLNNTEDTIMENPTQNPSYSSACQSSSDDLAPSFQSKSFFGTPEHYMQSPRPRDYGDIDIDALSCALMRAQSICILLGANFNGSGDRHSDDILCGATWALEGAISQAQMILWGMEK